MGPKLERLDPQERYVLVAVALLPPPVNLDMLVGVNGASSVQTLQWLESLVDKKLLQRCKAEGPGFYQLRKPDRATQLLKAFTSSTLWSVAETLVGLVQDSTLEQVPKSCAIANILCAAGYFKSEAAGDIMRCADHCLEIGHIAASTLYYQFILDHRQAIANTDARQTAFMDAVLGLISSCGHLKPLDQQRSLLSLARDTAIAVKDPYQQCLINLRLAQVLKTEGNYEEAADMYERAWELANQLGREDLLKKAALYTSDFLFWQGLVADAIARYEQVIGDLEKFPADPSILHACAALGWCYGICGQTARGAGLIEAVLGKAKDLGLVQVHVYALLMGVLNFLEARRMNEAAALLDELFGHSEETLGHYILWAGYASKAFILSCQGDLPGCYLYQAKAYDKSKAFGWHHHRGPWNFDYMDLLEETGVVHPVMNYDAEIKRLSDWPDVYMQGVGLRYKAQRRLKKEGPSDAIVADLKKSITLLKRAGARLEMARAQVLLARLYIQGEQTDKARALTEEAHTILSAVNPELFPEELQLYLADQKNEDFIINAMFELSNVIGTVQNRDRLLERIINLLMRLTIAGRVGFFFTGQKGELALVASRNLESSIVESASFQTSYATIKQAIELQQVIELKASSSASRWMLCAPIMLRKRILGVIYLDNTLPGLSPPDSVVSMLKVITCQLAIAINNAEAYEEIERLKDRLEDETRFYRMEFECGVPQSCQIIGKSPAIQAISAKIERVSATDATVLITGETGTGKELVARALHRLSPKREGPFISVNAASLDAGVIASELFGHEKGAFTGAFQQRRGRFELADGGTLFLDDIDTIPPEIQAKILRVIQEREFERVGGNKTIQSDFRLIASTNNNLRALIAQGKFRSDLYYRLNVFPIHVDPLRNRKEDIPLLANHFMAMFNAKFGKHAKRIAPQNLRHLESYSWPGNVREFRHIIERAVILSDGEFLVLPDLQKTGEPTALASAPALTFKEMECKFILDALRQTGGKVSGANGAAQLIGLKPTTLFAKMRKLGITRRLESTPAD